jgi:hypothetical protein
MDVYRIDLVSGEATLDTENPGDVGGWTVDDNFVIRFAHVIGADGQSKSRVRGAQDQNSPADRTGSQ